MQNAKQCQFLSENARYFFRSLLFIFSACVLILAPQSVSALSEAQLDIFAQNDILFYDPDSDNINNCYVGDGSVSIIGSAIAEKIWSGLVSVGFTEEQAAGIMGNMQHESGLSPARHESSKYEEYWSTTKAANRNADGTFNLGANDASETNASQNRYKISYGLGLIQWSFGRRANLYKYISSRSPDLLQFLNNPSQYGTINGEQFLELAGDSATNALLEIEIAFLWEEINSSSSYRGLLQQQTVYDATKFFLEKVEIPNKPQLENHPNRLPSAQGYYDKFAGTSIASGGTSASAQDNSQVTIIGDSITNGSRAQILSKFTGMTDSQIDAADSRQFSTGLTILSIIPPKETLIFALGTNDNNLTQSQIDSVLSYSESASKIVFVTNYGTSDYSSNNALLRQAQSVNPKVSIADWAGSVSADPERFISSDGVHPTEEGKALFAELIYGAINKNTVDNNCNYTGSLSSTVLAYAWPDYHSTPYLERMPAYADAVTRARSEGRYVGGSVKGVQGIDCGGFVTVLVQDSGYESDYNSSKGGTKTQERWVMDHGWTLLNSSNTTKIDTSVLQPGDIAFMGGTDASGSSHTFIYVGQIPGFNSVIASASYSNDQTGGRAPMAGGEDLEYDSYTSSIVRWYRKSN